MPQRIQMSRNHPWRADHPDAVIVDRRTKYGNPFRILRDLMFMGEPTYTVYKPAEFESRIFIGGQYSYSVAATLSAKLYREWVAQFGDVEQIRAELAGRDLACWCRLNQPCHADVLLELANGGAQ